METIPALSSCHAFISKCREAAFNVWDEIVLQCIVAKRSQIIDVGYVEAWTWPNLINPHNKRQVLFSLLEVFRRNFIISEIYSDSKNTPACLPETLPYDGKYFWDQTIAHFGDYEGKKYKRACQRLFAT